MGVTLIGGIGVFLLGMVLLTDGLKAAAGSTLRDVLSRLSGGPGRAAISGAAITALVQSSSATTLATIGFVSAGLLTFPQSVGIVFGANIGTTSTGWLVSLVGLKADITIVALPVIAAGALLRLLGRDRAASFGLAAAGFGLIFIGIDFMQDGMAGFAERVDLSSLSSDGIGGRLLLAAVGLAMTVLMQSSSAAIATTLTAVHADAIDLETAAALVVGQNVGTTVTAALAMLGASVPARRTAFAHIGFNVVTALIAFLVLPLVPAMASWVNLESDPALALAAFHTGFNVVGVALLLPVAGRYAAGIERLVPQRGSALADHLDPSVARIPSVALEAARRALLNVAGEAFDRARATLDQDRRAQGDGVRRATESRLAATETRQFLALALARTSPDAGPDHERHVNLLHALDHLQRLLDALDAPPQTALLRGSRPLADAGGNVLDVLGRAANWCAAPESTSPLADDLGAVSRGIADVRRQHRRDLLAAAATQRDPDDAMAELDALMWLDRIAYHSWRAASHLAATGAPAAGSEEMGEAFAEPKPVADDGTGAPGAGA